MVAKTLVLPFAVGFIVGALAFLSISLQMLLWPVVGPVVGWGGDDEPPGVFVCLLFAGIFFLPGIFFTGIAGALWLYIFGRATRVTYER